LKLMPKSVYYYKFLSNVLSDTYIGKTI